MVEPLTVAGFVIVAFAGGAIGASIGALRALSVAGVIVIAGEVVNLSTDVFIEAGTTGALGAVGITGQIGLGPGFGPHVALGGGVAAAAYAARKGYMDTGFAFHEAKNVTHSLGTRPDVLVVGGVFGAVGALLFEASRALLLPWDPVSMAIVLSAFGHRIALGYPLVGEVRGAVLDMTPFERGERRPSLGGGDGSSSVRVDGGVEVEQRTTGSSATRFVVEPWLPHQYEWPSVLLLGSVVGVFSAYVAYVTASPFLAFGISAASLVFLTLGVEEFPVTHHMALPAGLLVVALAPGVSVAGTTPATVQELPLLFALGTGAVFGLLGGLFGELSQRVLYAHADTHLDPPAASIVVTTLLIALGDVVGLYQQGFVPTLGL